MARRDRKRKGDRRRRRVGDDRVVPNPDERVTEPGDRLHPDDPLRPDVDLVLNHKAKFAALEDDVPVLLLPVRIETRFTEGEPELNVRIYPDQVHLDDHRPELTLHEKRIGDIYWAAWNEADAADDEEGRTTARDWLVRRLAVRRAAWVARATDPSTATTPAVA